MFQRSLTLQQRQRRLSSLSSILSLPSYVLICGTACKFVKSMSSLAPSPPTRQCRVAVAQVCSTASKWSNLLNVARCAGWATIPSSGPGSSTTIPNDDAENANEPCRMLFLPECFGFLGTSAEQTMLAAEDELTLSVPRPNAPHITEMLVRTVRESSQSKINEIVPCDIPLDMIPSELEDRNLSLLDGLRTIAKESNLWISAGGMHILAPKSTTSTKCDSDEDADEDRLNRKVYNTHVILDNQGNVCVDYPKIHLFDVCIPGQVDLRESKTTQAGTKLVACPDTPIGCLGVTICYDLRFPEMYTELVQTMGAQVLLVPSAFTVPTGRAHWHTLLRARAIENQCYVIAAAQYGSHNDKRESYGHALVVDPWGAIVVDAGGADTATTVNDQAQQAKGGDDIVPLISTPSIVTCVIDLNLVSSIRERMPIQQHRTNAQF